MPHPDQQRLVTDRRGNVMIEFAVISPILFLLLLGLVEFGIILFGQSVLESATSIGARIGKTGFSADGQTREEYIRAEVERLSAGLLPAELLTLTISSYPTSASIEGPEPCLPQGRQPPCYGEAGVDFTDSNGNGVWDATTGGADGPGAAGDIVIYRSIFPWRVTTPMLGRLIGTPINEDYVYYIASTTTVRNETFTPVP